MAPLAGGAGCCPYETLTGDCRPERRGVFPFSERAGRPCGYDWSRARRTGLEWDEPAHISNKEVSGTSDDQGWDVLPWKDAQSMHAW